MSKKYLISDGIFRFICTDEGDFYRCIDMPEMIFYKSYFMGRKSADKYTVEELI